MNQYDYYITPQDYETAAQNGISKEALEQRIRSLAWPKDRALTQPLEQKQKLPKGLIEIAGQNGISYNTFRSRIRKLGWTPERAATEPLLTKEQRKSQAKVARESRRKYPVEMIELARRNGIKYDAFRVRIWKYGWTPEEAATRPVMTPREKGLVAKAELEKLWFPGNREEKKEKEK